MPVLVGRQIGRLDPQQIFHGAGDVVALAHLAGAGDGAFEGLLRRLGVLVQPDRDIGHQTDADLCRINHRPVAGDHTRPLQFLHPAQAGRGRQPHPLGQLQIRQAAVA